MINVVNSFPLGDEHAFFLIEFDKGVIPIHCLPETIKMAGATILEIISLSEELEEEIDSFLLGTQDVRNVVLNLAKHFLIKVEGYNPNGSLK